MLRKALLTAVCAFLLSAAMAWAAPVGIQPYLDIKGQSGPSFSPDGSRIAFSTSLTGITQVWTMPIATGYPQEVSYGPERALFKAWSPTDERTLVYGQDRGGDENTQFFAAGPDGANRRAFTSGEDGVRHDFGDFSFDGSRFSFASNKRNRQFFDVYVMDVASGMQRLVFQGDGANSPAAWSHDGVTLLVSSETSNFNNDLTIVDLRNGARRLLTKHAGDARFESPAFSADDRTIFCVSDQGGREMLGRAAIDVATGAVRFLHDDYEVAALSLSRDGTKMEYETNREGYGDIVIADAATDKIIATPRLPTGIASVPEFDAGGSSIVFDFSGAAYPAQIWRYDIASNTAAPLTAPSLGGLSQSSFVEPTLVKFKSFDGLETPAWYYRPKNVVGRVPVIVDVHGGPEAQARPYFNSIDQYFIAHGYAVLQPNVRGSSGYGNRYLHLADVRKREDSVKDLHAAHDWLIRSGNADPKRIALYGGSYGGYMVLAGLTLFPDDWAAGVDIVGIANWVTFLQNTSSYRRANREATYGSLERDGDFLASISPIRRVDRIKAPLMIFMGKNDPRVPAEEGQQMADALRKRGIPVDLTIFANEGHGIARYDNRVTAYTKIAAFLDQYLR